MGRQVTRSCWRSHTNETPSSNSSGRAMSKAATLLPLLTLQILNGKMEVEHARMLIVTKAQCERDRTKRSHRKSALLNARKRIEFELAEIERGER